MLRENELIHLGFERADVPVEESGNKEDYFYYTYNLGNGMALISTDSTESIKKDKWSVMEHEWGVIIEEYEDVELLLEMFKRWKKI
jgi:hypothetical protein